MDFFQIFILSLVQGITEFLPISSTGHLILTASVLRIPQTDFLKSFLIMIQAGTIFSVVFLYWKKLFCDLEVFKKITAAFIPTAVVGFIFYKLIKKFLLGNPMVVIASLFLGGLVLIIYEMKHREKNSDISEIAHLSYPQAALIGIFQAFAMVPGISRSGATIIGGLCLGIRRKTIVEFSFLLAVPTMLAATALDLLKSSASFTQEQIGTLALGSVLSFLVAIAAIKFFIGFVQRFNLVAFGVYRILAAVLFWYFV